jgi:hypothetical protein
LAPANDVSCYRLSDVTDPVSSINHTVRFRYRKNAAAGATIGLTVELRQGYVNEGAQGTLIATTTAAGISETFTNGSIALSGGEADSITNYNDLAIRFSANQT